MEFQVEKDGKIVTVSSEVQVNGKSVDIATALPLLTRDWKAMGKLGITPRRLSRASEDVEGVAGYVLYVLNKINPAVTLDEIDSLTFTRLVEIMDQIGDVNRQVEGPFSGPLTSSPAPTDGP